MKSHPYEYKVLVEYVSPEEAGRYPHFTRIEDQEGLNKTLEDIFSHDIAISRNTLIITVLLRRPKKKHND